SSSSLRSFLGSVQQQPLPNVTTQSLRQLATVTRPSTAAVVPATTSTQAVEPDPPRLSWGLLGGDAGPARQRGSFRPSCARAPRGFHPLRTRARHSVLRQRVLRQGSPGSAVEGLSPRHRVRASAGCVLRP